MTTQSTKESNESSVDAGIRIQFHKDAYGFGIRKFSATFGIDVTAVGDAPSGELSRVDVGFDDDVSLADISLADLFHLIVPFQKRIEQQVSIGEPGAHRVVVAFEIPSNTYSLSGPVHISAPVDSIILHLIKT